MRFRKRKPEPVGVDTRMVAFMTRILLNDVGRDDTLLKWLIWVGTPLELTMTHDVWRDAPKAYRTIDSLNYIMTGGQR